MVAVLALVLGLGTVAHTMPPGCFGAPCDDHATGPAAHQHADDTTHQGTDGPSHDGCNPFMCHVMALVIAPHHVDLRPSGIVLGWQVAHLSTSQHPDSPDRPPNR